MLERSAISDFRNIFELMKKSFPDDEYRPYREQKKLLDNPLYTIYVSRDIHRNIQGFLAVWDFEDFAYIEHFAVDPECRNSGLGSRLISELTTLLKKPICLEVEPPDTKMALRRIGFYQRNGFHLLPDPYMQPPISPGKSKIPLRIMTSEEGTDHHGFLHIRDVLYRLVYHFTELPLEKE